MESLPIRIAEILYVLVFFGITIYAIQISWRIPYKQIQTKSALKEAWFLRITWWYGAVIQILIIFSVFLAMVILTALRLN